MLAAVSHKQKSYAELASASEFKDWRGASDQVAGAVDVIAVARGFCTIRSILGSYWDNGKEHGNYYNGLYEDTGGLLLLCRTSSCNASKLGFPCCT